MNTIEVQDLTKIFDNDIKAVNGISFNVTKGEILGFLGPNGAGKTTTLNMLSTLLNPTSGTAKINGHDINKEPIISFDCKKLFKAFEDDCEFGYRMMQKIVQISRDRLLDARIESLVFMA